MKHLKNSLLFLVILASPSASTHAICFGRTANQSITNGGNKPATITVTANNAGKKCPITVKEGKKNVEKNTFSVAPGETKYFSTCGGMKRCTITMVNTSEEGSESFTTPITGNWRWQINPSENVKIETLEQWPGAKLLRVAQAMKQLSAAAHKQKVEGIGGQAEEQAIDEQMESMNRNYMELADQIQSLDLEEGKKTTNFRTKLNALEKQVNEFVKILAPVAPTPLAPAAQQPKLIPCQPGRDQKFRCAPAQIEGPAKRTIPWLKRK